MKIKDKIHKSMSRIVQHRQKHHCKSIPDRDRQHVLEPSNKITVSFSEKPAWRLSHLWCPPALQS